MLVRVSYTEDAVPPTFDEWQNRTTRHLENEGWREYIVAWRKNRLELYKDHVSSRCQYNCRCALHTSYASLSTLLGRNGLQGRSGSHTLCRSIQIAPDSHCIPS